MRSISMCELKQQRQTGLKINSLKSYKIPKNKMCLTCFSQEKDK